MRTYPNNSLLMPEQEEQVHVVLPVVGRDDVYVIGDVASNEHPETNRVLPMLAQVAIQQGPHAAKNLLAEADGQPHPAKEALAELGEILAELDDLAAEELDLGDLDNPIATDALLASAGGAPQAGAGSPPADDAQALFGEAEGLRAAGRMDEAESHYYRALELFEKKRDAINAIRAVDRLLGLRPDDVVLHHQKNEFAIMTNDRGLLVSSYLDLAACLRRQNGFRSARTVYGRILDLDAAALDRCLQPVFTVAVAPQETERQQSVRKVGDRAGVEVEACGEFVGRLNAARSYPYNFLVVPDADRHEPVLQAQDHG